MNYRHLFAVLISCLFLTPTAHAQVATLLADFVQVSGNRAITASGNVEVLAGDTHLTASQISYDGTTDILTVQGPITVTEGDSVQFFAEFAQLSGDLQNGMMQSARLVLEQQVQLAAAEISRVDGRYTQLTKTVASSCRVCASNPVPLWQIRAESVIHDTQERQIYFKNAQLRLGNIPVFYLPRLRLPDPTLDRATGFLQPSLRTTSNLGSGIKIPYFVKIGDHADLTFTPYLSRETKTLQLRYRQAFAKGNLQFDSAISQDTLQPGKLRAYLFGRGTFDLPNDIALGFDFETASDTAYLLDYGYSGKDRLDSAVTLSRTREDELFYAGLTYFQSLRGTEIAVADQLPTLLGEFEYRRRFFPASLGGQGMWRVGFDAHSRSSVADQVGRDVARLGVGVNWGTSKVFANGIVARIGTELRADTYLINQDSNYAPSLSFATPSAELELRWPWVKSSGSGAAMIFTPVLHLGWTENLGANVPNEDSVLVEFDEGNLFALSRFPGDDRHETGARATIGAQWTRIDPSGWSLGMGVGRVYRSGTTNQFSQASGLDGPHSDWLVSGQLKLNSGLSWTARALVADDLSVTKAETQLSWQSENLSVASTYSWIIPDISETRPSVTNQATLDASYRFRRHWLGKVEYLYDFEANKATKASLGLGYTNECVGVDLSLSRRFTSSASVTPSTDFGLSVTLLGFGAGSRGVSRSCSGL